jgi:hypothetical protein
MGAPMESIALLTGLDAESAIRAELLCTAREELGMQSRRNGRKKQTMKKQKSKNDERP